jgi:hypothetical protein
VVKKGSNTLLRISSGMPPPVSLINTIRLLAFLCRWKQGFRCLPEAVLGVHALPVLQDRENDEPQNEDPDAEPDLGGEVELNHFP